MTRVIEFTIEFHEDDIGDIRLLSYYFPDEIDAPITLTPEMIIKSVEDKYPHLCIEQTLRYELMQSGDLVDARIEDEFEFHEDHVVFRDEEFSSIMLYLYVSIDEEQEYVNYERRLDTI
jgi:hypothetical protein